MNKFARTALCRITWVVHGLTVMIAASSANAVPAYTAVPIDTIQGASSAGTGINATGEVTGVVVHTGGSQRAFIYSGGMMQSLGTLGGAFSFGQAIDGGGQVTGYALNAVGTVRAFLYSGGAMRDLGTLGGDKGSATAINAIRQVTGWAETSGGAIHAFAYSGNTMRDFGTLGGVNSGGYGINESGEITGESELSDGSKRAFLYSGGTLRSLGTLGGQSSSGFGINSAGQVTGYAGTAGSPQRAFLYSGGVMHDLGTLGGSFSIGSGINARGDVTGGASTKPSHAFLYSDGTMYDLNALVVSGLGGATLAVADGINDSGQIAATGCDTQTCRAYRLDPVPTKAIAVEYRRAEFDHYFITAIPDEIAKLDNETLAGWARTGQSFNVYTDAPGGTSAVCRFFSTSFAPKSSHFYTPDASECETVKKNSNWQFEGLVFKVSTPDQNGACPGVAQPVYRLYNDGQGAAPNHRYTTSLAVRSQMIALGWIPEGSGPLAVGMCAPR